MLQSALRFAQTKPGAVSKHAHHHAASATTSNDTAMSVVEGEQPLSLPLVESPRSIRETLRANWKLRQAAKQEEQLATENECKDFSAKEQEIQIIRKENVFTGDMTDQENDVIQRRVQLQQEKFQDFQKRSKALKTKKIQDVYEYLSEDEISYALAEYDNDEDAVILKFTERPYLQRIRKSIALSYEGSQVAPDMTQDQKDAYERLVRRRKTFVRKTATSEEKSKMYSRVGRLRLDDALKQLDSGDATLEGWSAARIRAYKCIKDNPNAYYYRFNAPGENQRNGKFTPEEHKAFMKRLAEVGANGQWGIFSMTMPGRVGYQCSNYYRSLLEKGAIQDPNYFMDEKGKAHYLFSTTKVDSSGSGAPEPTRRRAHHRSKKGAKRRRGEEWDDDNDDEDEDDLINSEGEIDEEILSKPSYSTSSWKTTKRTRALLGEAVDETKEELRNSNPLPGFIDPITLEEVERPAISTYGHVMSYSSWIRCLEGEEGRRNVCPITKRPLTRRDLVLLTHDNIEYYRDKIVH